MAYQKWLCFDNAGHAQTLSYFSTAHRTRNTLAARLWFPTYEKKHGFSVMCLSFYFLHTSVKQICKKKKKYKTENRDFLISRNMFSVKNQMHVIPLAANPRDLKEQKQKHMFSMFSNFVSVYWVVFMFSIFCQCFSFLIISFNFCSFPAFLSWTNTLPI